jgi:hypothetical protein
MDRGRWTMDDADFGKMQRGGVGGGGALTLPSPGGRGVAAAAAVLTPEPHVSRVFREVQVSGLAAVAVAAAMQRLSLPEQALQVYNYGTLQITMEILP